MVDAARSVFRLAMQTRKNWVKAIEICVIVVPRRLNARLRASANVGEMLAKSPTIHVAYLARRTVLGVAHIGLLKGLVLNLFTLKYQHLGSYQVLKQS